MRNAIKTRLEDGRNYFFEAAELRITLQQNIDDYNFVRAGGRLVYLVDTNVVRIFLNPASESQLLSPFASDRSADYLVGTAVVTAEFLFSRQLAGQQGIPAFIAPGHADELSQMLNDLKRGSASSDESGESEVITHEVRMRVDSLIERVRSGHTRPDHAVRILQNELPRLVNRVFSSPFGEATQLLRLYEDDLLRPLASHPFATDDIFAPPTGAVRFWTDAIQRHLARLEHALSPTQLAQRRKREEDSSSKHRASKRVPESIRRDAEALTQVILLNDAAMEMQVPTRYVLITADRALYRTYALQFFESTRPKSEQFALRLPTQYIPILNVNEMPNGISESDMIYRTKDALDSLFQNQQEINSGYPQSLPYYVARLHEEPMKSLGGSSLQDVLMALYGVDPYALKGKLNVFEAIKEDWRESFQNAVVLNAELMHRRAKVEFDSLIALFAEKRDLQQAIVSRQRELIDRVEAAHLALNTRANLLQAIRKIGNGALNRPSRGPLAVRGKLPRLTGDLPLCEFIEKLATHIDERAVQELDKALVDHLDDQALFFAACVAYRCSVWTAARHYALRALDFLDANASSMHPIDEWFRHEVAHLFASSIRFASKLPEDLSQSRRLLRDAAKYYQSISDPMGTARALSEEATVILTGAFWRAVANEQPNRLVRDESEQGLFDLAGLIENSLDQCTLAEKLEQCGPGGDWNVACEIVKTQIHANIVGYEVFRRHVFSKEVRSLATDLIERGVAVLTQRLKGGQLPIILEVELLVLNFDIETDEAARQEIVKCLREAIYRQSASAPSQTQLDQEEFSFFLKLLPKTALSEAT